MKIILASPVAGTVTLDNEPKDCKISGGQYVKIFEFDSPTERNFTLNVNYPKEAEILLTAIPEVNSTATAEVVEKNLHITPTVAGEKFLRSELFQGKEAKIIVDGAE